MRLLQIDSCLATGSTGRITESIAQLAQRSGWECFIIHGARYVKRPSCMTDIQTVSIAGEYEHYLEGLLFDNHGLASRRATKNIVEIIKRINPDIIQLHCIHGYYLNYRILFEYLNKTDIPIVWTFHDCWAFTGHCAHFMTVGCKRWKTGCHDCPSTRNYPKSLIDCSPRNYFLKKALFSSNPKLHIVSVSKWMASLVKESFLKNKDIRIIPNGIDLSIFRPNSKRADNKMRILGVSGVWSRSKGLDDFFKLRKLLDREQFEIVLVGLSNRQKSSLPDGIIGIEHTDSVHKLVEIYSSSDVFVNPTYADTFPTVNIEALACGTPVITYRTGGSPEAVSEETGWVVEQGDVEGIARTVIKYNEIDAFEKEKLRKACRIRAEKEFDKQKCFESYLALYRELT